jgi:hypothetical protein
VKEGAFNSNYDASTTQRGERGIFSPRLDEFLTLLWEGETPNSGTFCAFCYNPLSPDATRCDHCGQIVAERPAIHSVPRDVVLMHRRMRKRESVIVNSFAFFGLGLGLALFLGMVAINVLYLDKALWFFLTATVVFLVASRIFAGIIGGVIGDEIGYRYGHKKLAEDWRQHLAEREGSRTPGQQ